MSRTRVSLHKNTTTSAFGGCVRVFAMLRDQAKPQAPPVLVGVRTPAQQALTESKDGIFPLLFQSVADY